MARIGTLLLGVALGTLACACDGEVPGPAGSNETLTARVTVESAIMSRCNQMMSFAELSFTFTIENTSAVPIVVGTVAFDGTSAHGGETYATGDIALSAPVTLPVDGAARFSCRPDVPLTWSPDGVDGALTLEVALSNASGRSSGQGEGADTLRFMEAWDSCDTYATAPHPCQPIPMN